MKKIDKMRKEQRIISIIALAIVLITMCTGCGNHKSAKNDSEKKKVADVSEPVKKTFMDGIFPIDSISEKTDTIFSCRLYQNILKEGLMIDNRETASVFGIECNQDSTVTLIKAVRYEDAIMAFFLMEYSDLMEMIINQYDFNGKQTDSLKFTIDCSSDVLEQENDDETIVINQCCIYLNSDCLYHEVERIIQLHNISADSYEYLSPTKTIDCYTYDKGLFNVKEELGDMPTLGDTVIIKAITPCADTPATFPGGEQKMNEWISRHLVYPPNARESHIEGRVIVQFIVKTDGSIGDVEIIRGVVADLDAEALRVVKSIPRFNPAMLNGKAVDYKYTLPIFFRLR